jgi:hypothetical protein
MKKQKVVLLTALMALIFALPNVFAAEAPTDVMEVVVIDVTGASGPFAPLFDRFNAVYKKHKSPARRELWSNYYAGPSTGLAIVTIRYPTFEALAADTTVTTQEYQAVAQEFQQQGFKVASRSMTFQNR